MTIDERAAEDLDALGEERDRHLVAFVGELGDVGEAQRRLPLRVA